MGARRRIAFTLAVSAALLVPLAVFGGSSFAKGFAAATEYGHGGAGDAEYEYGGKVTICHRSHSEKHPTRTITVDADAVKAHLRHGDTLGPCPGTTPPPAAKSDDDGQGNDEQNEHHGASSNQAGTAQHGDQGQGQSGGDHGNSGDHGGGGGHH